MLHTMNLNNQKLVHIFRVLLIRLCHTVVFLSRQGVTVWLLVSSSGIHVVVSIFRTTLCCAVEFRCSRLHIGCFLVFWKTALLFCDFMWRGNQRDGSLVFHVQPQWPSNVRLYCNVNFTLLVCDELLLWKTAFCCQVPLPATTGTNIV